MAWWKKTQPANETASLSTGLRGKVEAEQRRLELEDANGPAREAEVARLAAEAKARAEEKQRQLELAWLRYMLKTALKVNTTPTTSPVLIDGLWLGTRLYTVRQSDSQMGYFIDLSSYSICPKCIKLRVAKILGTANPVAWTEIQDAGSRVLNKPYDQALFNTDYSSGEGITRLAGYMHDLKTRRCKVFDRHCDFCGHPGD